MRRFYSLVFGIELEIELKGCLLTQIQIEVGPVSDVDNAGVLDLMLESW
jgi:hypothetical protein